MEIRDYFIDEFIKRDIPVVYVDNIILTISEEGYYYLDVKDYDLFSNTEIPLIIDEILEEILENPIEPPTPPTS